MILSTGHPKRSRLDALYARIDELKAESEATEEALLPLEEHRDLVRAQLNNVYLPTHRYTGLATPGYRYQSRSNLSIDPHDAAMSASPSSVSRS